MAIFSNDTYRLSFLENYIPNNCSQLLITTPSHNNKHVYRSFCCRLWYKGHSATYIARSFIFIGSVLDLLWPTLLQLGLEKVEIRAGITAFNPLDFIYYPISHSLIMALVWSALLGGIAMVFYQNLIIATTLCVLSHWVLDLTVHIPDLPIYWSKNSPKVGLGLWNHVWLTMALEFLLLALGLFQYIKTSTAQNWMGIVGLWG
jgi:hypothetical protein